MVLVPILEPSLAYCGILPPCPFTPMDNANLEVWAYFQEEKPGLQGWSNDAGPVLLGNTPVATMAETVIRVKDASSVAAAEMRRGYCQCCADCS